MAAIGNGLKAVKTLRGDTCRRASLYPVDASNAAPIFQGDPVVLSSGKAIGHSADGAGPILGVVRATYQGRNRPNTHNLPSSGNFLPVSTAGWVDVIDDPDAVFLVEVDSAAAMTNLGQLCEIVDASAFLSGGNKSTGASRAQIDGSTIAAQTSGNVQTLPFRVVGLPAETEKSFAASAIGFDMGVGSSARAIEVVIANHIFRQTFPT